MQVSSEHRNTADTQLTCQSKPGTLLWRKQCNFLSPVRNLGPLTSFLFVHSSSQVGSVPVSCARTRTTLLRSLQSAVLTIRVAFIGLRISRDWLACVKKSSGSGPLSFVAMSLAYRTLRPWAQPCEPKVEILKGLGIEAPSAEAAGGQRQVG